MLTYLGHTTCMGQSQALSQSAGSHSPCPALLLGVQPEGGVPSSPHHSLALRRGLDQQALAEQTPLSKQAVHTVAPLPWCSSE